MPFSTNTQLLCKDAPYVLLVPIFYSVNPYELLMSQYCFCPVAPEAENAIDSISELKSIEKRNNKNLASRILEITEMCKNLIPKLDHIKHKDLSLFSKFDKSKVPSNYRNKKIRSNYIGVTRNGKKWQALVVYNNEKIYIGSFQSEIVAAVTFDFFSMVLHFKNPKVNFYYTTNELREMIDMFLTSDGRFMAENFLKLYPKA